MKKLLSTLLAMMMCTSTAITNLNRPIEIYLETDNVAKQELKVLTYGVDERNWHWVQRDHGGLSGGGDNM